MMSTNPSNSCSANLHQAASRSSTPTYSNSLISGRGAGTGTTTNAISSRSWFPGLEGTIDVMLSGLSSNPTSNNNNNNKSTTPRPASPPQEQEQLSAMPCFPYSQADDSSVDDNVTKSHNQYLQQHHQLRLVAELQAQLSETQQLLQQKTQGNAILEARCQAGEIRLREQDQMLQKVLYEQQQLNSHQNHHNNMSMMVMIQDDKKEEDEVMETINSNNSNNSNALGNQFERTQDALFRTETALAHLQTEQKKERLEAQAKLAAQQLESQQTIENLRKQVLDYSGQLTVLTAQLADLKADSEAQEAYRREEAEDLRVLHDAQEEELALLRSKLEEAVQELEAREEQEIIRQQPQKIDLVQDLRESLQTIQTLEKQIQELQQQLRQQQQPRSYPNSPLIRMAPLVDDDDDDGHKDEASQQQQVQQIEELQAKIQVLETRASSAEKQLFDTRASLQTAEAAKMHLLQNSKGQLQQFRQASARSEASLRDQLADMEVELSGLRSQLQQYEEEEQKQQQVEQQKSGESSLQLQEQQQQQSRGLAEDELRQQVQSLRQERDTLQKNLDSVRESSKQQLQDVQDKMEDRDTTISALVKSSVALEQQLVSSKIEVDALRNKLHAVHAGEAGLDVNVTETTSTEHVQELVADLEKYQASEKRWLDDIDRLQMMAQENKVEITQLRSRLEAAKSENLLLRGQLENMANEAENNNSDSISIEASSSVVSSTWGPQIQIQERDNAIANLVQQSIEQDRLVTDLQSRLASMQQQMEKLRLSSSSSPTPSSMGYASREEIQELRKETEMFASQVIEQDEEIEALTKKLHSREEQLATKEAELEELRKRQPRGADVDNLARLTAEADELTEANNVLRDEVRLLRRKTKEMESSSQEIDRLKQDVQVKAKDAEELERALDALSAEKANLSRELQETRIKSSQELKEQLERIQSETSETIRNLQSKLKENESTIVNLRAASSLARNTVDELEVENLRSETLSLQRNLQHQTSAVESAKGTIRELERMLAERNSNEAAAWEEEKEELLAEIETLTLQFEDARQELKQLEEQRNIIEDFKQKLEDADDAREQTEKAIVDTYERKLSLLKLDKDVTIDKLRKELADTKEAYDEELEERIREIEQCKAQISDLRDQMTYEIREREAQIFALERTLEAQEQLVNNMKSEMDILQGSMENKAVTRREEIEVMQQELVDLTTLAAQQERDIRSLQGKLQDQKLEYDSQVTKLKETIALMESEEEEDHRTAADLKMEIRVREVKDRLEKLKWRNTSLSEENEILRDRLLRTEDVATKENQAGDRIKELERVLAERDIKLQMIEAELKELKVPPTPVRAPPCQAPSSKNSSRPPTPTSGKTTPSRRLGFLSRRPSEK